MSMKRISGIRATLQDRERFKYNLAILGLQHDQWLVHTIKSEGNIFASPEIKIRTAINYALSYGEITSPLLPTLLGGIYPDIIGAALQHNSNGQLGVHLNGSGSNKARIYDTSIPSKTAEKLPQLTNKNLTSWMLTQINDQYELIINYRLKIKLDPYSLDHLDSNHVIESVRFSQFPVDSVEAEMIQILVNPIDLIQLKIV